MTANEREILDLEKRFWDAMKEKDARLAADMTDDRCIIVGAQGVSQIDGPAMAKLTEEGPWQLEKYSFDEKRAEVQFIGSDVAIVAYTVDEVVRVDGEALPIEAHDASVWVRRDDTWRCTLHTESLSGDPYGRDRQA